MKLKLLFACLLGVFLAACGGKGEGKPSNKLTMVTAAVRTLDSVKATDSASFNIIGNTQETLLVKNNNVPGFGAAKSFSVSEDGKIYTFKLRDNLKWSDGKKLTSKDFKYAWMRLLNPNVGAGYAFFLFGVQNARDYYLNKNNIKASDVGILTPDDSTLVVKLNNPIPYFTQIVSFGGLSPQRQDIVEKYKDTYGSKPERLVYSGPFMVSSWVKGSKIELVKNPNYWNAKEIKLDLAKFMEVKEISTQFQMFASGQLDVLEGSTGEYIQKLEAGAKAGKWSMQKVNSPSVFYVAFNPAHQKALQSPKIRLALSLATDRKTFVDKILKSNTPAYGLVPADVSVGKLDYRKIVAQPLLGVKKDELKKMFIQGLQDLGLDPDPSKYTFSFLLQKNTATAKTQGEYLKNLWEKEFGIKITLVPSADFSDFLQKLDRGDFDLSFQGWNADYNSPLTFLDLFGVDNGSNYGRYNNERVNKLLVQLQSTQDAKDRIAMFKEIENIYVVNDPAFIPVYYKVITNFAKNYVHGLQLSLYGGKYQLRWTSVSKK